MYKINAYPKDRNYFYFEAKMKIIRKLHHPESTLSGENIIFYEKKNLLLFHVKKTKDHNERKDRKSKSRNYN